MSFQALNWAVRQRVGTPVGKGILMALANYADEKGTCFPSHERIARETELSDKSVRVHMKRFEDLKIITAKRDRDDGQRHVIIRYTLALDRDFDLEEVRGKRKKKLPADQTTNEETTSGGPLVAGTAGPPPVSDAEKPPVSEGAVTLSKNNPSLSLPSQPEPALPQGERENLDGDARKLRLRPGDDPAREVAFKRFLRPRGEGGYPPEAIDDVERARTAWGDVEEAEWDEAVEAIPRFLRARKDINRGTMIGLEKYIRDTKWRGFPSPKMPDGSSDQGLRFNPWSRPIWALFARRLREGKSVEHALTWIRLGATVPSATAPTVEEEQALAPVLVGSDEHAAWIDYCARLGFSLPRPDFADVIFLPTKTPPALSLRWRGYHLIEPVFIPIRGPAWWWRVYRDNAPMDDLLGNRSFGNQQITMGPIALSREAADMVQIDVGTEWFPMWERWFEAKGARLLALGGSIWAPSREPPAVFEPEPRADTPDWDAIDQIAESVR